MTYDSDRARVVLFGGASNPERTDPLQETHEWDGSHWHATTPSTSPPARVNAAMGYDTERGEVVLFGGSTSQFIGAPRRNDTWVYRHGNWYQRTPNTSPAPREGAGMVFDSVRRRIMLFGGHGTSALRDTWEWDGTDWALRASGGSAPPHGEGQLAFDSRRGRAVWQTFDATYEWDGAAWSARPWTTGPRFASSYHPNYALAYDTARQRVMLHGTDANAVDRGTWEWDGSSWTQRTVATPLPPVWRHSMTYDAARQRVVLFGGIEGISRVPIAETWLFDGTDWSLAGTKLPQRQGHAIAYDGARRRLVMFGGTTRGERTPRYVTETYVSDGLQWIASRHAQGPGERTQHAMAYDATRQQIVLFGGLTPTLQGLSETFVWDGTTWSRRTPTTSPRARGRHAMAFDGNRQRVVLFGGWDPTPRTDLADFWEWTGSDWQSLPSVPAATSSCELAFDDARRRLVLFDSILGQTWEHDGSTWSRRLPNSSPPSGDADGMAYDAARQRVVLWRAQDSTSWEWDGTTWSPSSSGPGESGALAYDAARARVVAVGYRQHVLGTAPQQTVSGDGCGGARIPELRVGEAYVGNVGYAIDLVMARGSSPYLIGFSTSVVLGGCWRLAPASVVLGGATDGRGFATVRVPVPNLPSLRGQQIYLQGLVADSSSPWAGLATTPTVRAEFGD